MGLLAWSAGITCVVLHAAGGLKSSLGSTLWLTLEARGAVVAGLMVVDMHLLLARLGADIVLLVVLSSSIGLKGFMGTTLGLIIRESRTMLLVSCVVLGNCMPFVTTGSLIV